MSRCYVIKNKAEDKYLYTFYIYEDENFAFGELNKAKLFDNLDNANDYKERIYWVNSNLKLEVVPITIAEENLEHKIAVLEKALEEMYDDLSDACSSLPPYEWYIQQAEKELKGEEV